MRILALACNVFFRESCALAARSPHEITFRFMEKGLHSIPSCLMRGALQEEIDRVDGEGFDAIVLVYGLCNHGLAELRTRRTPLVIPRSHDCIGIFMGSRAKYLEYFHDKPGTYFQTTGWIERSKPGEELQQLSIESKTGMDMTWEQLVEQYGEDNAEFLWEELCDTRKHYKRLAYIRMGVADEAEFEAQARRRAEESGWEFEPLEGDLGILQRLFNGDWNDEEFLVVPPGKRIEPTQDERIVEAR